MLERFRGRARSILVTAALSVVAGVGLSAEEAEPGEGEESGAACGTITNWTYVRAFLPDSKRHLGGTSAPDSQENWVMGSTGTDRHNGNGPLRNLYFEEHISYSWHGPNCSEA